MIVDPAPPLLSGPFTFFAKIWPTLPMRGEQTILAQWDAIEERGFRIGLAANGNLALSIGGGPVRSCDRGNGMQSRCRLIRRAETLPFVRCRCSDTLSSMTARR